VVAANILPGRRACDSPSRHDPARSSSTTSTPVSHCSSSTTSCTTSAPQPVAARSE